MRQWLLVLLPALLLLGIGVAIGVPIGRSTKSTKSAQEASSSALTVAAVGDACLGAEVWSTKRCSDCHSYAGKGGKDGPPLDYMSGKLSASDIANMSGRIWNHAPAMAMHFRQEKIPFPTFTGNEMANLIAYLHGGPSPAP